MRNLSAWFRWEREINPLLYGVAFTGEQETIASEAIFNFLKQNNAPIHDGLKLKALFREGVKVRSWLELMGQKMEPIRGYDSLRFYLI